MSQFLFAYIDNIYDSRKAVFSGFNLGDFRAASNISQKGHFFWKTFTATCLIPFLSLLHQNKSLYDFPKRGRV